MPYIKVNANKIKSFSDEFSSIGSRLSRIRSDFSSVSSNLDWDVKSASSINNRVSGVASELTSELNSISKMYSYLFNVADIYSEMDSVQKDAGDNNTSSPNASNAANIVGGESPFGFVKEAKEYTTVMKEVLKARKYALSVNTVFKNGKIYLGGYSRTSALYLENGLTGRYNYSTWIKKGATRELKFDALDYIGLGISALGTGIDAGKGIADSWSDENKSTEKKICDTYAYVNCAAANVALQVGGKIVSKIASGAVSAACCAIPVVGPVIGAVAGVCVGVVVDKAFGIMADTMMSEAVVSRYSDAAENVGKAAKSGVKAVSAAADKLKNSDSFEDAVVNAAELMGTVAVEGVKVAATAVVESVKTACTVIGETAKNIGKAVTNFFKGW